MREVVLDDSYYLFACSRARRWRASWPRRWPRLTGETFEVWWHNRRESVKTSRGKRVRKKPREECGCALVAHQSTWHKPLADGTKRTLVRFYYRCATYRKRGRGEGGCSMSRNYRADKLESKIWGVVRGMMLDPASVEEALARGRKERTKKTRKAPDRLPGVLKALSEREKRRDGYLELAADGLMPKPELAAKLGPLNAEISALRGEADALAGAARKVASDEAGGPGGDGSAAGRAPGRDDRRGKAGGLRCAAA